MKYRKKPVEVEAVKFVGSKNALDITTLEGNMTAREGDYIIQGVHGELYPCKPDIFEETYERVDD